MNNFFDGTRRGAKEFWGNVVPEYRLFQLCYNPADNSDEVEGLLRHLPLRDRGRVVNAKDWVG